jgi:hypothetical protein
MPAKKYKLTQNKKLEKQKTDQHAFGHAMTLKIPLKSICLSLTAFVNEREPKIKSTVKRMLLFNARFLVF